MDALSIIDSVIDCEYDIDTYRNVSTLLFYIPYIPFSYQRNTLNIDNFYIASNKAYVAAKVFAGKLRAEGLNCEPNPSFFDYKAAAARCGCGRGKNTLVYRKDFGSRFAIGAIRLQTELPFKYSETVVMPCENCGLCQEACPLGAISDKFHRNRCMREYMLKPERAAEDVLRAFECRLLGCDICQNACPVNKSISAPPPQDLQDMLLIENFYSIIKENKLEKFAGYFGWNYCNKNSLLSMLLIAAGNTGDKKYVEIIRENLNSPSGRVKFAAAFAQKVFSLV
jgi:epoxyqueuosine reductase